MDGSSSGACWRDHIDDDPASIGEQRCNGAERYVYGEGDFDGECNDSDGHGVIFGRSDIAGNGHAEQRRGCHFFDHDFGCRRSLDYRSLRRRRNVCVIDVSSGRGHRRWRVVRQLHAGGEFDECDRGCG